MQNKNWRHVCQRALLLAVAILAAGCNHVQVFASAAVKGQDGAFFIAQQFAQYEPFRPTELRFELREDSLLTITFSAAGSVTAKDPAATLMPPVSFQCRLDGKPCAPGNNESQIPFKFQPLRLQMLCCDTRAFTWVVPRTSQGAHTVMIWGQIRNPEIAESAQIGDWSLVINALGH